MARKDYSEICPIFAEGNEKELVIPIRTSGSISVDQAAYTFGREVTIMEAHAHLITGSLATTSSSCTIGLYKGTLSTIFGSIICSSGSTGNHTADIIPIMLTGSVTSTSFTSTDILCIAIDSVATDTYPPCNIYIRYRDS